jgi:hypothetical protein
MSYYKGTKLGKRPACAICAGPGAGERELLHLPAGVSVWLCAAHRRAEFLTRRAGRDLVASLMHVWRAAGCLDRRRSAALDGHLRRLQAGARDGPGRPGSYAWPTLRREAEERFAAGEPPAAVIAGLRRRHAGDHARVPSERTMRRWFAEGRWLSRPEAKRAPAGRPHAGPARSGAAQPPPRPDPNEGRPGRAGGAPGSQTAAAAGRGPPA